MSEQKAGSPEVGHTISEATRTVGVILEEVGREVIGQGQLRRRLLTSLITEGHILLEGVPGLAKTLSIKALAQTVEASFQRIQFTPDLLPADLIGTEVFRPQTGMFEIRKGPLFANFILADEINRAPAKVQSALLETMQEKQVTIGERTLSVPEPFFVLATQNPIEQEGTYPLPEAQVDRFMMKVKVDYPDPKDERMMLDILTAEESQRPASRQKATLDDVRKLKEAAQLIYVDDRIRKYIMDLVLSTRTSSKYGLELDSFIELGASPRAVLALFFAARAEALISGEHHVVPQMVKDVAPDVLRHRILLSYEAEAQGLDSDTLIQTILNGIRVP